MLNRVRYQRCRVRALRVVWHNAPMPLTIMAVWGPRRMAEAITTTYDTDMLEPLAMGSWILNADSSDEATIRIRSGGRGNSTARVTSTPKVSAPSAMTAMMYQRAPRGRLLSKIRQYIALDTFKHLFYTIV
jgi:hypothetical protein